MLVYIPTLGREGKQITLESIPERWKEKVILVCPKEEKHDWENRIDVPKECVGHINKTRQWILEQSLDPHVGMLDDDLKFYQRDSEVLTKRHRLDDAGPILDLMEQWLEEGEVYCGVSNSFMSHNNPSEYYYGKPTHSLFADRDYLAQKNIKYTDIQFFSDFHVPMCVLESGRRLRYTGEFIAQEYKGNAPGGCSITRNSENLRKSMLQLVDMHPKYIEAKEEEGAQNQNIEVGVKLKFLFAKAYKENVTEDASLESFF